MAVQYNSVQCNLTQRSVWFQNMIPELRMSFLNRITYWYAGTLPRKGYRNPITKADLWDLNTRDTCQFLYLKWLALWTPAYHGSLDANCTLVCNEKYIILHHFKTKRHIAYNLQQTYVSEEHAKLISMLCSFVIMFSAYDKKFKLWRESSRKISRPKRPSIFCKLLKVARRPILTEFSLIIPCVFLEFIRPQLLK